MMSSGSFESCLGNASSQGRGLDFQVAQLNAQGILSKCLPPRKRPMFPECPLVGSTTRPKYAQSRCQKGFPSSSDNPPWTCLNTNYHCVSDQTRSRDREVSLELAQDTCLDLSGSTRIVPPRTCDRHDRVTVCAP